MVVQLKSVLLPMFTAVVAVDVSGSLHDVSSFDWKREVAVAEPLEDVPQCSRPEKRTVSRIPAGALETATQHW